MYYKDITHANNPTIVTHLEMINVKRKYIQINTYAS